ncbi:MAG TPA: DAK2 domain-containing protein [Candidatus Nitrosotalea sp.]|nr:DAK2 domain-containing protein [Candidatus Nitrosotalea sp.]
MDGQLLKRALLGSVTWLAAHQEEVNRLNVFPVPDGDTGTNMLLTLEAAVEDIRESSATEVHKIAKIAAHGSLMGSRGNSGVILSQIFRGFGNAVQGQLELTPKELGRAFEEAANAAYRAVRNPTEGTILTVAREVGRAAVEASEEEGASASSVIRAAAAAAARAVEQTPSQLSVLREAGVVDAGGYGLQIMLEGMLKSVEDLDLATPPTLSAPPRIVAAQTSIDLPEEGWGYCTEFLIEGEGLDLERVRQGIEGLGDSALVVGDPELLKVHVHSNDPTRVIAFASNYGRLVNLNVGDMSSQHQRIRDTSGSGPRPVRANALGIVAVASGPGLAGILLSLGVDAIVEGGQTMNPSTKDMVRAVEAVGYESVILLPNNKNVVLAANQVGELTPKRVCVLPTKTMPEGVAAVVAFSSERSLEDNLDAMERARAHIQTIEVTHAVRDSSSNGLSVRAGQPIALINDELAQKGEDYAQVVTSALTQLGADRYELVTVYPGKDASEADTQSVVAAVKGGFERVDVEVQPGGQELYPFILSVE